MPDLKTIQYRGGLVSFSIPASWLEEYAPEGGGTFYEDVPDSSTLRLNVLTLESPHELTKDSPVEVLTRSGQAREIRRLPNGNAVARYTTPAVERGHELDLHYWEVAGPFPPRRMRLAIFAYTVLARRAADPAVQAEIQLLDTLLPQTEFAKVLGVLAHHPPKPWWKFW